MSRRECFSGGAAAHVVASLVACHVPAMVHPVVSTARPDRDGDGVPCPGEIQIAWSVLAEISRSCTAHHGMPCLTVLTTLSPIMPQERVLTLLYGLCTLSVLHIWSDSSMNLG